MRDDVDDERDYWQEHKDDQLMGPPREEPDDPEPIDLDEIDRHYHEALAEDMSGIPEHSREALAAVPELLAELRDARAALEELYGWEYRHEFTVTPDAMHPQPDARLFPEEIAAFVHTHADQFGERKAWQRTVRVSPWAPYEPPAAPPF